MNKFKVALVRYDTTELENAGNTELAIELIKEAGGMGNAILQESGWI